MNRIASPLPAVFAVALLAASAQAQPERRPMRAPSLEDLPKLTVRGEAELLKPADQLRLDVGVVTEAPDATDAMQANSRAMQDVVMAVKHAGLTDKEYETGRFNLRPVYSGRPRTAGAEWRPKIVAYEVTNTLSIKTRKLELAGKLIQSANEAGANTINSIGFDLADPRVHRAEAIAAATANARGDAAVLARAADVKLVRILSITLDEAQWRPPVPMAARAVGAAMAESVTPPITPGDVTVRASVTIQYEIGPDGNPEPAS